MLKRLVLIVFTERMGRLPGTPHSSPMAAPEITHLAATAGETLGRNTIP